MDCISAICAGVAGNVVPAHAPYAHGVVAQDVGDVDGDAVVVLAKVLGDGEPVGGHGRVAVEPGVEPDVAVQLVLALEGGVGYAVDADQLGCHALPDLGVVVRRAEYGEPGVGVEVDEAGADYEAGRVDGAGDVDIRQLAAPDGDSLAVDDDGGVEAGASASVDYQAVLDQQVGHATYSLLNVVYLTRYPWPASVLTVSHICQYR